MKCYIVNTGDEWCSLVHAQTRGQAIQRIRKWVDPGESFLDFSARRCPGLDNRPITYQNAKDAGFEYGDGYGGRLTENYFTNDCHCELCSQ